MVGCGGRRQAAHSGGRLTPPVGDAKRVARLPAAVATDISVEGSTFRASTTDVAVAGMGWIGVAAAGTTDLRCRYASGLRCIISFHNQLQSEGAHSKIQAQVVQSVRKSREACYIYCA